MLKKLIYNKNYIKIKNKIKDDYNMIYEKDYNGEIPIHIATRENDEYLINFFIKKDKKILSYKTKKGNNSFHILALNPKLLIKYINLNKNIKSLNNKNETVLIKYILSNNKLNNNILNIFYKKKYDINNLFYYNKFEILLKDKNYLSKLKLLINIFKNINLNTVDLRGNTALYYSLYKNDISLIKYLIQNGAEYNKLLDISQNNIITTAIKVSKLEIIEYLLTLNIDYNYVTNFNDTYLHLVLLLLQIKKKQFNDKILRILINNTDLNIQNVEGNTSIHLLIDLKIFKKYINIIEKKSININLKNKFNKQLSKIIKIKYLKKLNTFTQKNNIKIMKLLPVKKTSFTSYPIDNLIYDLYLLEKYKNISFPLCNKQKKINMKISSNNNPITNRINYWINSFNKINNSFQCFNLVWFDNNNNFICNIFEKCIKKCLKKTYILIHLIIINIEVSHANIIIIDNHLNLVERFDPYGIVNKNDVDNLDNFIKKNICNLMIKLQKKKYQYLYPKNYLKSNIFQSISNHDNDYNGNHNEVNGFCLAWCYWYIESRILNADTHPKILINKLNNKLINNKVSIIEYIRAYSNKLDKYKNKLLKTFNFEIKDFYKKKLDDKKKIIYYKNIYKKIKKLIIF